MMMPTRRRYSDRPKFDWYAKDTIMGRHLYFIQSEPGTLIKIGSASNPWMRLNHCQVGCPIPLWLIGVVWEGGFQEREVHKRFQYLREHGEWFRPDPELLAYIAEHASDACDPPVEEAAS